MKRKTFIARTIRTLFLSSLILFICFVAATAQVASNPPYTLEQSVIASGGGVSGNGGAFKIEGSIGQAVAGTNSTNNPFAVRAGFWMPPTFAPTAATVTVSGRVLTPDGSGLKNARVVLTDSQGNTRTAISSSFGYYSFPEVEVGQTYIFAVISKRYEFAPQAVSLMEELNNLIFTATNE